MLEDYGIYPTQFTDILATHKNSKQLSWIIKKLLENDLTRALIKTEGTTGFIKSLKAKLHLSGRTIETKLDLYFKKHQSKPIILTGAEVSALVMKKYGIKNVFAYPGTSELVLCDTVLRVNGIRLINGRGDTESAFMAAGGCLFTPCKSAAILHAARGLTNAAGAVANAHRNEVGVVFFVGLPSTTSQPFLPPHGETNLIKSLGNFTKDAFEIKETVRAGENIKETRRKAVEFIKKIKGAILEAKSIPYGPILVGIPQDVLENRWIPYELINKVMVDKKESLKPTESKIKKAANLIKNKKRIVILVDDFLFKASSGKKYLKLLAEKIKAPILQVHYRRGPMLFERVSSIQNPYFAGPYNPLHQLHQDLMQKADLIITLEDRNAYERVIGKLPNCSKIAITCNSKMTLKNKYLQKKDILLEGKVSEIIAEVLTLFPKTEETGSEVGSLQKLCKNIREKVSKKTITSSRYHFMRTEIATQLANIFNHVKNPVLVDDSQMFGGLLAQSYEKFPKNLRVFGDHTGFVGGGIAYAAGLANLGKFTVFCTLGDQAFTNGLQGLIAVVQEKIKVIYLVCNNKGSISLAQQIQSQDIYAFDNNKHQFLANTPKLDYTSIALNIGLRVSKIKFDPDSQNPNLSNPTEVFYKTLLSAAKNKKPTLIELELPSDSEAWANIWAVKGNESPKT